MEPKKIDVRAGKLFPFHFHILGGVFLLAAIFVVVDHPMISAGATVLALLILTASEGTEINPAARTLREYYSFFFLKTGKARKYSTIEGIAIHRAKVSQKLFTARTTSSSTFTHIEYNAYLSLYGEEKIFLMSDRNKTKLMAKVGKIASDLKTTVVDHTTPR